ncbi:protein kinase [Nonomuraea cavernae]|uniref:serine/threonine-protein kinase n=2 Tax=Nonomuraea cavernae TaxID=2045107 RepID=UPI001CDA226F|nr:serine/threonine protein kinase [Nonomuraea cavernae]MCA2190579.1 protein kinase [Nonomuraea cavernae]
MTKLGKVGPYTLLERLGRGGMGEVYLASARRGERVALKVLHDLVEDDSSRIRLEREVRALRRVESPYVARVLDADLDSARPYLVMEHIEGATLLDRVRHSGPLNLAQLVELAQGIATALAIIHAAGVVHRDLKPANILMGAEGPVLIDFGIAQVLDATRLTMTGTFLGTPGYTAPEIFADEQVESPADVHAWAATVAFAATGRPTFGRGTAEAQMYAVLNGQADLKGVPVALLPLVRAALNREPGKRPTAALLADRLARLAKATGAPDPDQPGQRAAPADGRTSEEAASRSTGGDGTPRPGRGRVADGKVPAPRGRANPDGAARSRTNADGRGAGEARGRGVAEARGRASADEPGRGSGTDARGRAAASADDVGRGRGAADAPGRGRGAAAEGARGRAAADGTARSRAAAEGPARSRTATEGAARTRTAAEGKVPAPRGRVNDARVRARAAEAAKAGRARTKAATGTAKQRRAESGATTLPAGNTALLLLAVLAVPCVVASVIWPIATIVITAVFVVLIRLVWMSHWMVRKRTSRRWRTALRVLLFPFALAGSAVTAVVWPGVPVSVAAGGALWLIGGGQIAADWWLQPAPVTAAGVVFGMLCGGITGREIERIGEHLPELRREGLRALAVLGGFVALCAAAVRAIALLL